ncbi:MAG: sigma-54-dependent Fis family transcriptional regulator [Candidatus Delongbacteria bacterium]|nr:sigma-54-dependent Fis family transcriptional regulator [Candidatus Delongbacteria bacterium]
MSKNKNVEPQLTILLVDDYPVIDRTLGSFLREHGYLVHYAGDAKAAIDIFEHQTIDIIITDLKMPGEDGFSFISKIKKLSTDMEIIIITGHGDLDAAIQAIRMGVSDFILKPVNLNNLLLAIEKTRVYHQLKQEKKILKEQLSTLIEGVDKSNKGIEQIIGASRPIQEIKKLISKIIEFPDTSVLIEGESGTGKELIARAIHFEGPNADKPFIPVNSSSIPETLIESELFGHEKGSFTDAKVTRKGLFEIANGGTIFLDEIGDISLSVQKNLLRVLENREIRYVGGSKIIKLDFRVVAATNKNLEQAVEQGEFRRDLFYRLNIFRILVPPLRERKDDITRLAEFFLREFNLKLKKNIRGLSMHAAEELMAYPFPGNIRELKNIVEQAVILCDEEFLMPRHFPILMRGNKSAAARPAESINLEQTERNLIIQALKNADYNKAKACKNLGITRDSLRRKMDKYSINIAKELRREDYI